MLLRKIIYISFLLICAASVQAQILEPAKWSYDVSKKQVKTGEEVELIFNVKIDKDWYLYSSDFDPDLGPTVTTFTFQKHPSYQLLGDIKPVNPKKKYDDLWGGDYTYFTGKAQFRQKIKVLQPDLMVKGAYDYQVCTDVDGKCIPFDDEFIFTNKDIQVTAAAPTKTTPAEPAKKEQKATETKQEQTPEIAPEPASEAAVPDGTKAESEQDTAVIADIIDSDTATQATEADTEPLEALDTPEPEKKEGLMTFFGLAFIFGLGALLTPCVFPMIPMTVSFFTSSSSNRAQGVVKALVYGFSIIAIYTIVGTIFAKVFGSDGPNFLSTHWIPNVLFFLIFIIFAMSFFGMFEITLPSSFLTKVDAQADKGGWVGVFFMAFTLVLVSFSCTGPIVGSILVASAGGETLKPIMGMLGFSLAFALPFTLFAVFPSWLSSLPKSGGWLNSVKVVLGFIELALAFKFLSIADQVYHWGILDRDIYIAIWIVIFALLGFYLLGKLKFSHDSDLPYISVPRLFMAVITFSFVVYLIPGLFGAPLKALAGYLPPQSTHDFDLNSIIRENNSGGGAAVASNEAMCEPAKYSDFLHLPHGLKGYFDLEQAKKCARELNKPIFIDFTGHGCVNCREMEATVWSDPEVLKRLREDYVVVALYVDDKTELPESEWYVSEYDNKEKRSIGKQNADYQVAKFNVNAQPYYVLMDANEKALTKPISYDLDVESFVKFLDEGKANFSKVQ